MPISYKRRNENLLGNVNLVLWILVHYRVVFSSNIGQWLVTWQPYFSLVSNKTRDYLQECFSNKLKLFAIVNISLTSNFIQVLSPQVKGRKCKNKCIVFFLNKINFITKNAANEWETWTDRTSIFFCWCKANNNI